MNRIRNISTEIANFYPTLQMKKRLDDLYKEVLKEKFSEFKQKKVIRLGIIHQTKSRTKWKWKNETYQYLKDQNVLASAISIKKEALTRYVLDDFKLDATYHLRITPKRQTKLEKNMAMYEEFLNFTQSNSTFKEKIDYELLLKSMLMEEEFDEVINLFKVNKLSIKTLEQKYENRKKELFKLMNESNLDSFKCSAGNGYKINQNKTDYDMDKMVVSQIPKIYSFSYRIISKDGDVEVVDHLNNNHQFLFKNETIYEGQRISLYKGRLHVNGQRLKTDVRAIFENPNGSYPAQGTVLVDSEDLFMNCSISSTKIEGLLDLGLIEMDVIEKFKYKESDNDVTEYFEVISENSEEERKKMFKDKLEKRLALQKEKVVPVFNESDYDNEEEDIFELEAIF